MTAEEAVKKGRLVVNLPPFAIMAGGLLGSATLLRNWFTVLGCVASFGIAWLYWALAVPRWRIWALRSGADPEELQLLSVNGGVAGQKGSFFEKTELPPRS
jgi:hypothetical protein